MLNADPDYEFQTLRKVEPVRTVEIELEIVPTDAEEKETLSRPCTTVAYYPKVNMPPQPQGYIKAPRYEFF